MIRTVGTVLFLLVCIALIVVVLMQEGKSAGFLSGQVDSYVRKNHGRTREGKLERATVILAVIFFALAIALSLKFFR